MSGKYLVVDKSILPPYCEKVAEAKRLVDDGTCRDVSEAVRRVGISRSTYYKYRNFVKEMSAVTYNRHAMISMMMQHEVGLLQAMLKVISNYGYSVWTINQNPPVESKANVVVTLDLGDESDDLDEMISELESLRGISRVQLLGID
ncbi:MAG: ACT domain-containing protein [Mogibacterium sp.]|nr:ACT domain-containing protein [Mogibacterium sp.]